MARVLVVDDDESIRRMIALALEGLGFQVTAAQRGDIAVHELPDDLELVVTDICLPHRTGVELAMELRRSSTASDVPVLFVTAYPERCRPLVASGCPNLHVLQKPFKLKELCRSVNEALHPQTSHEAVAWTGESHWI